MKKRHRSPSYPSLTLTESVDRARKFYLKEGKHAAPVSAALTHWGYSPKSSGGLKTISSLKAFGLMKDSGATSNRVVSLTNDGLAIIQDDRPESPERDVLLKQAAIKPKIIADLVKQYHDNEPSDETLRFFLVQRDYNPIVVSDIIKVYKDTAKYINLSRENQGGIDDVTIGDYIQWESQGALQFKEPAKVTSLSDDGEYVFVAESGTGIPVAEVEVVEYDDPDDGKDKTPPANPQHTGLIKPPPIGVNMRQDTFTLQGQGEILIQFPSVITKEDFEDFTDYIDILKRKIGRSVIKESEQTKSDEKDQ